MKIDEIKELIKNGRKKNSTLPLSDLEILKRVSGISLEIDRETNDYFYKIPIKDLIDKEFDKSILTDNKWELSLDEEFIILFL